MPEGTYYGEVVDWSGDWATPWGLASQMRPWSEQREWSGSSDAPRKLCSARKRSVSGKCFICSESKASATKRSVGTEINPLFCRRAII